MALLIDGYNLMHAAAFVGRGHGPGGLERSRQALLDFVAESLDEKQRRATTVVFDAAQAPPGLPRWASYREITVRFAEKRETADELIEQLIAADSTPRRLVVVSSDHRLHRAARRRRATPVDSDRWYAEVLRRRAQRAPKHPSQAKPDAADPADIEFWLEEFGDDASRELSSDEIFPPGYAEDEG